MLRIYSTHWIAELPSLIIGSDVPTSSWTILSLPPNPLANPKKFWTNWLRSRRKSCKKRRKGTQKDARNWRSSKRWSRGSRRAFKVNEKINWLIRYFLPFFWLSDAIESAEQQRKHLGKLKAMLQPMMQQLSCDSQKTQEVDDITSMVKRKPVKRPLPDETTE